MTLNFIFSSWKTIYATSNPRLHLYPTARPAHQIIFHSSLIFFKNGQSLIPVNYFSLPTEKEVSIWSPYLKNENFHLDQLPQLPMYHQEKIIVHCISIAFNNFKYCNSFETFARDGKQSCQTDLITIKLEVNFHKYSKFWTKQLQKGECISKRVKTRRSLKILFEYPILYSTYDMQA